MLNHLGTKTIETKRLLLRRFLETDASAIYNNWAKDPENVKYLTWQAHSSINDTYLVLNNWIDNYSNSDNYNWCVTLKETGETIGNINVVESWPENETCEIGYVLSKKHWGKGIMPEAAKAVIKFLFLEVGFNRIQAKYDIDNPPSGKVMEKLSMQYEGTLRQYCKANSGKWCDAAIHAILRDDFLD